MTGELYGWVTDQVAVDIKYDLAGPNVWARNVNDGYKQGQCTIPGDSGASIYTIHADGGIVAKGIHSGGGGGGDYWGGLFDPCYEYYTDIWQASTACRAHYGNSDFRRALLALAATLMLVGVIGCARTGTAQVSASIFSFQRTGDRTITVTVVTGVHDTIVRTTVQEDSAAAVTVDVIVDGPRGGVDSDVGVDHEIPLTLKDPLGDRKVFDGKGHEVREERG